MLNFEQARNQTRRKARERHAALTRGGKFSREQVQKTKMSDKLAKNGDDERNLGERVLRKGKMKGQNPQKDPKLNPQEASEMSARQWRATSQFCK